MNNEDRSTAPGPAVPSLSVGRRGRPLGRSLAALVISPVLLAIGVALTGCPGAPPIEPVDATGKGGSSSATLNQPAITFFSPLASIEITAGETVDVVWTVTDSQYNAAYVVWAAPVSDPNTWVPPNLDSNPNKKLIAQGYRDDIPSGKTVAFDPVGLATGSYAIRGTVSNGVSPTVQSSAAGILTVLPPGLRPRNRPPTVQTTAPANVLGVIQSDNVRITWCANDSDDKAKVLILLDLDDDPTNDVQFQTPAEIAAICSGTFPQQVSGAILLACKDEADCKPTTTQPTVPPVGENLDWIINVASIPPRINGDYYRVRVDVADGTNPRVHSYASGGIAVLATVNTSIVDLAGIGQTLAGAVFQGPNAGDRAGHAFTYLPDLDNDTASEFVIVSQYGFNLDRGNMGMAYLIYGRPELRFGGRVFLSSVASTIRGFGMMGPKSSDTEGITNVTFVPDLNDDDLPELLLGLPHVADFDASDPSVPFVEKTPYGGYMMYVTSTNYAPDVTNGILDLTRVGSIHDGSRFRGPWWTYDANLQPPWVPDTRFAETIASMDSLSNGGGTSGRTPRHIINDRSPGAATKDAVPEILVSGPDAEEGRGQVVLFFGQDFVAFDSEDIGGLNSIPRYHVDNDAFFRVYPGFRDIVGAAVGDHLGYADSAGDFNRDGNQDILMGAPGASAGEAGMPGCGKLYVLFGRIDIGNYYVDDITNVSQPLDRAPRVEIRGVTPYEGLGAMNKLVNDISGDGLPDVAFGVPKFDPVTTSGPLTDAGMVGVLFGAEGLTGENLFNVTDVGTTTLPGVRFLGTQSNGQAGARVASAGNFNGDSYGDLLVVAPNETRNVNGQVRRGVVYLIFGGTHLKNKVFQLSEVGTTRLPGAVFISPFAAGTADEATLEAAEAAGDVDGDGFGDILIGCPSADYFYQLDPSQRREDAGQAYLVYGTNGLIMNNP